MDRSEATAESTLLFYRDTSDLTPNPLDPIGVLQALIFAATNES